jgi:hypothetical protein
VKKLLLGALALACVMGVTRPARADWVWVQRHENPYARTHFYLGIAGQGVAVVDQTGPRAFLSSGGGFDLFLGLRANRWVAIEAGWQPTFHNVEVDDFGRPVGRIGLQALTLDVKIFPVHGRVQPYFSVGGGAYLMGDNFDVFAEGPGFQIGGGIDFWLSRWGSLGLRVQYRGVDMIDYDPANDDTFLSMIVAGVDFTARF